MAIPIPSRDRLNPVQTRQRDTNPECKAARCKTSRLLTRLAATTLTANLMSLSPAIPARPQDAVAPPVNPYRSPYSVRYSYPTPELIGDITAGERGKPENMSPVPFADWYSDRTRKKYGAWGPPAKALAPPDGLADKPARWKRERVIAVAMRYEGYSYQHHHLPDWDPPASYPWKRVAHGSNARGTDCSNLTGFVYNVALGIKLTGDIGDQAAQTVRKVNGRTVRIQTVPKPASYEECRAALRTGDLLYINERGGTRVSHVVLWVGDIGQAPDGVSLVLDSTGAGHKDANGVAIPNGTYLRPFRASSWYWRNLSHVHRVIRDDSAP